MASTMKDLAQKTGLGLATISKYFNGGTVREKNRILIENAVQELHFIPNEVARSLKTHRIRFRSRLPQSRHVESAFAKIPTAEYYV